MSSTDADAGAPDAATEEPSAEDVLRRDLLETFTAELGDAVVASEILRRDLWIRVRPDAWKRTARIARSLDFDYFCFLSGLDWMPHTWPNPKVEATASTDDDDPAALPADDAAAEEAEPEPVVDGRRTGRAGGDTRFQVFARLYSTTRHMGVTFKADLDEADPRVETWSDVYAGADWHERETWEMYGFRFDGHRNLTKLYLPGQFEGFPLRKDFPLLAREVKPWPGLVDVEPMPETASNGAAAEQEAQPDQGEDG
ncbi:MAG: NADH-quinone oxidoreductase subunit C [Actinomycetota bacterium]|nr:NADH-quinone oxidoreductase subunit C [Actinomycetota bacterium]